MKGYFFLYGKSAEADRSGIGLKVRNQIKTFNQAGLNCKEWVFTISRSRLLPILYRLPFFNAYPVWEYKTEFSDADYIYMRRPFVMNGYMRKVLKKIRDNNPKIKIIVEIPTYPYDDEYATYKLKKMLIIKDKYNRTRMRGIIDYYAILTNEKEIFGVPTIKIFNGIDVDSTLPRVPQKVENNTIHMCAVAMFKEWHGYERLIEGLNQYYTLGGKTNIICHFVGEGSELKFYKKLVSQYSLQQHVIFHGFLEGKELDEIYNMSSISLGSFGMYKKNLDFSCDLKSREAIARGIPMVTGCPTDIFCKEKFQYYLEFPNDSSILNIGKIIDFHRKIYEKKEEVVIREIRNYAKKTIDMSISMQNIISFISNSI